VIAVKCDNDERSVLIKVEQFSPLALKKKGNHAALSSE